MDLGIIAAVAMLALWAAFTFTTEAAGWVHILLTLGVFFLIERISARARARGRARGASDPERK